MIRYLQAIDKVSFLLTTTSISIYTAIAESATLFDVSERELEIKIKALRPELWPLK